MGHMIELVVMWLAFALPIGVAAGAAAFVVRALGKRGWSTIGIVEGAFAVGIVMGFVLMLFAEIAAS
jgi:hypothetical protein